MDDLVSLLDSVMSEFVPVKGNLDSVRLCNCLHPHVYNGEVCRCGKCILCRVSERSEWSFRLDLEALSHRDNMFTTLTYNDENLPLELERRDCQLFMKRLRKVLPYKIRFFGSAEYGDRFTHRPHYHFVFFGMNYEDFMVINSTWDKGFTQSSVLSSARTNYVCGYVQKKLSFFYQDDRIPDGFYDLSFLERALFCLENNITDMDFRRRPYAMMSTHPGLGLDWFNSHYKELENKFFIPLQGVKHPIPRYFRRKLYEIYPTWQNAFSIYMENNLSEQFEKFKEKYHNDDPLVFYDYQRDKVKHRAEEFRRKNELYFMKKMERDKRSKVV